MQPAPACEPHVSCCAPTNRRPQVNHSLWIRCFSMGTLEYLSLAMGAGSRSDDGLNRYFTTPHLMYPSFHHRYCFYHLHRYLSVFLLLAFVVGSGARLPLVCSKPPRLPKK